MGRIVLFLVALFLCVTSLTYSILYLNLLTMGYSLKEYFLYLSTRSECLLFFLGYPLLYLSILPKRRKKNDLHI